MGRSYIFSPPCASIGVLWDYFTLYMQYPSGSQLVSIEKQYSSFTFCSEHRIKYLLKLLQFINIQEHYPISKEHLGSGEHQVEKHCSIPAVHRTTNKPQECQIKCWK
jgi:hypothetical protein